MFEGEKYLAGTKDSFDVVSISIWPQQGTSLKGLVHEDFHVHRTKDKQIIIKVRESIGNLQ